MAPNVPESYLKARQEQIINAAVACFSRKGFHQTTMKDICEEAGLSPGAVYNYFSGKEDIVTRCAEISLQRNIEIFASASGKGTVEAFKDVLQMLFSLVKQENIDQAFSFDLELWAESTRNQKVRKALRKNEEGNLKVLTEMVVAGQQQGIFNPDIDALSFASLLFSMFVGFEVQMASNPNMDIDSYKAVLDSFIEGTLVNKANL
ncbi:MAG: TetR/AcrR family transcriptional regulator [Dehalococcoidales bacterium]|nr:TetR/AcrR family transcriptional regulator [Dehalococcoidales bacterium]